MDVFSFSLLKFEEHTWMFFLSIYLSLKRTHGCFFIPFSEVWRQHMDVYSFYLLKPEDNTCMVFSLHLHKSEDNTWLFFFSFHLLKSEDNTRMFVFFPFIYVNRQHMDVFSIYLSLKTTHGYFFLSIYICLKTTHGLFSFVLTEVWRQHMYVFSFYLLKSEDNTWMVFLFT